jgi:hypothetical protein
MKRSYKICTLFIGFFISATVFAQHNFKKGYIILENSNDTLKGFIDDGGSMHNSFACNYKKDSAAAVTDYQAKQLKGYGFAANIHFVSKNIKTEGLPAFYFLERLVTGSTLNLYHMNEQGRNRFFIEKENVLTELTNDDVSYVENGATYTKKSEKYKGALKFLMQDAPSLIPDLQQAQLTRKSLIAIVKKYHETTQKTYTLYPIKKEQVVKQRLRVDFGIVLGYTYSKTKIGSTIQLNEYSSSVTTLTLKPQLISTNFPGVQNVPRQRIASSIVFPGIFFNINRHGKNSFQIEINYLKNTLKTDDFSIQTNKLFVPIMYRRGFGYLFKGEIFVNAGLNMGINLSTKTESLFVTYQKVVEEGNTYKFETVTEKITSDNTSSNKINFGLTGGLGLRYDLTMRNTLEVEVRTGPHNSSFSNHLDNGHVNVSTGMTGWRNSLVLRMSF